MVWGGLRILYCSWLCFDTLTVSIDLNSIVGKTLNYFSVYTIRTESLKSFQVEYRQILSRSRIRWLSLYPVVNILLEMHPVLRTYFESLIIKMSFQNKFSEAFLWFAHSIIFTFHDIILKLEKEKNSLVEIINVITSLTNILIQRNNMQFLLLKVKSTLTELRNEVYVTELENFRKQLLFLSIVILHLNSWTNHFIDLIISCRWPWQIFLNDIGKYI